MPDEKKPAPSPLASVFAPAPAQAQPKDPARDAHLDAQIDALLAGRHADPFSVLGPHPVGNSWVVRFFRPGAAPYMLQPKSAVLYFLQRLRDEAHRYAIGAHRTRRAAEMRRNPLDEIEGVGPARKKALLHAFGSARGVSRASADDLAKVEGVSAPLAGRIHAYFRKS